MVQDNGDLICPSCGSVLFPYTLNLAKKKEAQVEYCYSCGGFWGEHWIVNNLTYKKISFLIKNLPSPSVSKGLSSNGFVCPCCKVMLQRLLGENIPNNLNVYACPRCFGNWFPKGELLRFKSAQESKLAFYKNWNIPLKSIYQILLPLLVLIFTAVSIPFTVRIVQTGIKERILASEVIKKMNIMATTDNGLLIFFETAKFVISEVVWEENNRINIYTVSQSPAKFHQIKITSLEKGKEYKYKVIIYFNGKVIQSVSQKFIYK